MATGVNLYELTHAFWKEHDYEPFTISSIALFFFLLERANNRHWKMPIRCSTVHISRSLMISDQTVINSRVLLYNRGIITYTKGRGNSVAPCYTIITDPKGWRNRLEDGLGDGLGDDLGLYNEDKNIKNKISSLEGHDRKDMQTLEELENIFLADTSWHSTLISFMSAEVTLSQDALKQEIVEFFQLQKCKGVDKREEKDCRNHFINWLRIQLKQRQYAIQSSINSDKRRGADVTATSSEEYTGSF